MATKTKTINLSSAGVKLSNISTGSYTTPTLSKNGGSHRAQIDIDLYDAFGLYGYVSSATITYTVYGSRTSWAQGTAEAGSYSPGTGDQWWDRHGTSIGRGIKNATTFTDEFYPNSYDNKVSLILRFTNEIAALNNTFTVSNVSITLVIEETYIPINTGVSPTNSGKVTVSGNNHVGSTVTLTATANDGYKFTQWQDGDKSNPRSVAITMADVSNTPTYIACFEAAKISNLLPDKNRLKKSLLNKQEVKAILIDHTKVYG